MKPRSRALDKATFLSQHGRERKQRELSEGEQPSGSEALGQISTGPFLSRVTLAKWPCLSESQFSSV